MQRCWTGNLIFSSEIDVNDKKGGIGNLTKPFVKNKQTKQLNNNME